MAFIHFTNSMDKNTLNWLTEKGKAMQHSQSLWVGALWQAAMPMNKVEQPRSTEQSTQSNIVQPISKEMKNNPA